ncbi:MAG TPA: hypothetical protein VMR62_02625 [Bryobacteraceae bacterium]|jgi:hypothetical protein|nr:hypothetical protein [Bryobacteraceae bacterium]
MRTRSGRTAKLRWLAAVLSFGSLMGSGEALRTPAYVYTAAPNYDADAWARGRERFAQGAAIRLVNAAGSRDLAPGFFASADPEVSFDGQRVLFAGKPHREDPWQIWEVPVTSGAPRCVAGWREDSIRPLYLPDDKIVYARKTAQGYQLEVMALAGGQPLRITYAPRNYLTCDVLHDGRVLYEADGDLYTVYPDGSGVESYRCEHGVTRHSGRQLASRDIAFTTGKGFARFTAARATQTGGVPVRAGELAGPLAEVSPIEWLVAFRPNADSSYAIHSLNPVTGALAKLTDTPGVEPVLLAAREVPLRFPSGLHDWAGANLLCLNAYTSKTAIAEGSISSVRLYSQGAEGKPALLGETSVESDGSFFLHVPGDQPLRMELRDRSGRVIAGEHGWFWMRRGEQRVCVGCHAGPERAPDNAVPKVLLRADVPVQMTGKK